MARVSQTTTKSSKQPKVVGHVNPVFVEDVVDTVAIAEKKRRRPNNRVNARRAIANAQNRQNKLFGRVAPFCQFLSAAFFKYGNRAFKVSSRARKLLQHFFEVDVIRQTTGAVLISDACGRQTLTRKDWNASMRFQSRITNCPFPVSANTNTN